MGRPALLAVAALMRAGLLGGFWPDTVLAQAGPPSPCAGPPALDAEPGRPPVVQVWSGGTLGETWRPAACMGWTSPGFRVLVAITGTFRDATAAGPLGRLGAISALPEMRYWSVTDGVWEPLVSKATALTGFPGSPRGDFTPAEITPGKDLYYAQQDNRSSGTVTYRIHVLDAGPDRLMAMVENVSPIRRFMITLFGPGDLQSFHLLERRAPAIWTYRGLTRAGLGSSHLAGGHERSYENRALASFRFLAGLPTDRTPPAQ